MWKINKPDRVFCKNQFFFDDRLIKIRISMFEKKLYKVGIFFTVVFAAFIVFINTTNIDILKLYRCSFHEITGLYCPGCGGTRATVMFFKGHIIKSFIFHPFVPYCMVLYIIYMIRGTIAVLSRKDTYYMKFRMCYVYIAVAILLIQFVIKNYLLIVYGIDILKDTLEISSH